MTGRAFQSATIGLLQHISNRDGMTAAQLEPLNPGGTVSVKTRLASMVKRGTICRKGPHGQSVYSITDKGLDAIKARAKGAANLVPTKAAPLGSSQAKRMPSPIRTIGASASISESNYKGRELQPYEGRPGAMDAFAKPSRMGNWLHYRDGRVEHMPSTGGVA